MNREIDMLGVRVDALPFRGALARVQGWLGEDGKGVCRHVVTANPEIVMIAQEVVGLAQALDHADLVVADGMGLVWASRILGTPLPHRIAGIDLTTALLAAIAKTGERVFLLGAKPGVAQKAADRLATRFPGLQIVGTHHGYFHSDEEAAVIERIESTRPHLCLVALGVPRQELWIAQMRRRLPVRVMIGVGGALDVFAGEANRAPVWMQEIGLEWLYRLLQEPWRIRRMQVLPRFAIRVLQERWRE